MSLTKVSYSMINGALVNVLDFGASPSATGTANATAFNAAITYCKANSRGLVIPDGTYSLPADSVNFAGQGLVIVGEGTATLQFTGTGRGFVIDTLLASGGVFGEMHVENLLIIGGPNITDGFYSRGIVRSTFKRIEVRECNNTAFTILHGVSSQYDSLKFSTNVVAQTTTPLRGLVLDNNGAGYYTANCTFINPIMEGFTGIGCSLLDASGNIFLGGTFEGMTGKGLTIEAECRRNSFNNVWFEQNTMNDIVLYGGVGNSIVNCYIGSSTSSPSVDIVAATGTQFIGGFVRECNLQLVASNTAFIGSIFSDNASLAITGAGATDTSFTTVGCTVADVNLDITGKYDDNLGERGSWTPTVTQGVGVTATITNAEWTRVGKLVNLRCALVFTSAGTGGSAILIGGIPAAVAPKSTTVGITCGATDFRFAGVYSVAAPAFLSLTAIGFAVNGGGSLLGISPATALAINDSMTFTLTYDSDA